MSTKEQDTLVELHLQHAQVYHQLKRRLNRLVLLNKELSVAEEIARTERVGNIGFSELKIDQQYQKEVLDQVNPAVLGFTGVADKLTTELHKQLNNVKHNHSEASNIITRSNNYIAEKSNEKDGKNENNEELNLVRNVINVLKSMNYIKDRILDLSLIHDPTIKATYDSQSYPQPLKQPQVPHFQDEDIVILLNSLKENFNVFEKFNRARHNNGNHDHNNANGSSFNKHSAIVRQELQNRELHKEVSLKLKRYKELVLTKRALSQAAISKQLTDSKSNTNDNDGDNDDDSNEEKESNAKQKLLIRKISEEQANLKRAKIRSAVLAEFISALMVSSGLNWANDERLEEIVLFCGEQNLTNDDDDDSYDGYDGYYGEEAESDEESNLSESFLSDEEELEIEHKEKISDNVLFGLS